MNKKFLGCFIGLMLGVLLTSMMPITAQAGSINGNEASVISAASGTFTYNGKQYVADGHWIEVLTNKLSADDVDLTAEQASSAISQMFGNVARGVSEGYLIAADGSGSSDGTQTDSGNTQAGSDTGSSSEDDGDWADAEDWSDAESDGSKAGSNTSGNGDSDYVQIPGVTEGSTSTQEEGKAIQSDEGLTMPDEEKASATITYDAETGKIVVHPITDKQESKSSTLFTSVLKIAKASTVWILLAILGIIMVVCTIWAYKKECFPFGRKGEKGTSTHNRRKRVRNVLYKIIGGVIAVDSMIIMILLGILFTTLRSSMITQSLNSSNYYNAIYGEYKGEEKLLLNVYGYSEDVLADVMNYQELTLLTKQSVTLRMQGDMKQLEDEKTSETATLKNEMEQALIRDEMAKKDAGEKISISAAGRTELCKALSKEVLSLSDVPYVSAMIDKITEVRKGITGILIGSILLLLYSGIVLWNLQHRRYRGIQCMAYGILGGCILTVLPIGIIWGMKLYENLYVDPYYLYTFFMTYIKNVAYMFAGALAGGCILFCLLMAIRKVLKKYYDN